MNSSYQSLLAAGVEKKYRELENRIMEDVVRRILKTGKITSSADYQLLRYSILGNSTKDIEDIVKKALGGDYPSTFELYDEVIEQEYTRARSMYEQVNETFIPYEDNLELQQVTNALINQSNDELFNITKSMGFKVSDGKGGMVFWPLAEYYNQYLDNAMVEITSGAFDYNSAIRRVVAQMTNSGLRTVEYASGHTNRCDVAARRAIMTGLSQLTSQVTDMNAQRLHTEYFEVDWHANARPSHRVWQGKVYTKQQLIEVCGLGTGPGLLGWNCYHTYYPFIPGISERNYTDKWLEEQNRKEDIPKKFRGKEYTGYEATQKQRKMETAMRAQRQKVRLLQQGKADADDIVIEKCKYQAQIDEYKAFSKTMGLQTQMERVYYDLQGRVAPSKETYEKWLKAKVLDKGKTSNIIKSMEYESLESQRLGRNKSTTINKSYIDGAEYKRKYDSLTDNKDLNKALYSKAKEMLHHRTGTMLEDMYWLDVNTGKVIAKEITENQEQQITYSKATKKAIQNYHSKGIITLHTHPSSYPPSIADFNANKEYGYELGVIACHDGKVFAYSSDEIVDERIYDFYIANGYKKGYNEYEAQLYALKVIAERYNIRFWEVTV